MFDAVTVLIFVFDVNSFDQHVDLANYQNIVQALSEYSPSAKIFTLIHKMDLVPIAKREGRLLGLVQTIRNATLAPFENSLFFYGTSIWDQTLYKAWTAIIYSLIPNVTEIENKLRALAVAINARELILYERTTCLMVTHISQGLEKGNPFLDRFERISSILKTHNNSLLRHQTGSLPDPMSLSGMDPIRSSAGGIPAGGAGPGPGTANTNLGELHIKTGRFSFFIVRLTENANLATAIPPSEQAFNIARASILEAQPKFAVLDFGGPTSSAAAASSAASTANQAGGDRGSGNNHGNGGSLTESTGQSGGGGSGTTERGGPAIGGGGMAAAAATLSVNGRHSGYHSHRSGTHPSRSRRHGHHPSGSDRQPRGDAA